MKYFVPSAPPLRLCVKMIPLLSLFTTQLLLLRPPSRLPAGRKGVSLFNLRVRLRVKPGETLHFLVYPSMKFFVAFAPPLCLCVITIPLLSPYSSQLLLLRPPSLRLRGKPGDTLAFEIALRICPTTQYPLLNTHYPLPTTTS